MKIVVKTKEYTQYQYADERQKNIYRLFAQDSFLNNEKNADHFMLWITFFRRNMHRFATDYLGFKLHFYQVVVLYLMGICRFIVIIASRSCAKSWVISLGSCCRCILYPNSIITLTSSTKGQSKLLVAQKIEKELMGRSPKLKREIEKITTNQNEIQVHFRNNSIIVVVPASDNARGHRSTFSVREEFRGIKKVIDDSVISPFQIIRQPPYLLDDYYANIPELLEEPVDVYISSSWFDNGSEDTWMWQIVDNARDEMLNDKPFCLLAFDESITLKHHIKSLTFLQSEKKKLDPLTWRIEYLNERVKENRSSFFTYSMLHSNQVCKHPFYPRTLLDFKSGKKNPYLMPKVPGEIRIVGCDMAFIENSSNDNSIYTCMRLLPESVSYKRENDDSVAFDAGYRRIPCYIESKQGGETKGQAIRIRQLFEDFQADYIVLDARNAGISIFDTLARTLYDDERGIEYPALTCMNDENVANRIKVEGAEPRIFVINASAKLNSDIAIDFRRVLAEHKIDFLVSFETAGEEILPKIKEYNEAIEADDAIFYEKPFLETQMLISETSDLTYEKKADSGIVVVREAGSNLKDRYTSCSYTSYFATLLERDLVSQNEDYEFATFIN